MRKGEHSEEELRRRNARNMIERYTHYYERYHAHDVARKKVADAMAGGDERSALAETFRRVTNATKLPDGQLRFLTDVRITIVLADLWRFACVANSFERLHNATYACLATCTCACPC